MDKALEDAALTIMRGMQEKQRELEALADAADNLADQVNDELGDLDEEDEDYDPDEASALEAAEDNLRGWAVALYSAAEALDL